MDGRQDTTTPRTARNYDRDLVSFREGVTFDPEQDKAQQSFKDEADINTIVRRFGITGQMPGAKAAPMYGDFTGVNDYQSAQNALINAREAFMALPAEIREEFRNDPGEFLAYVQDPANEAAAIEAGLLPKKPVERAPEPPKEPPKEPVKAENE